MAGQTALEVYDFISIIRGAPREIAIVTNDIQSFHTLVCNLENSLRTDAVFSIVNTDAEVSNSLLNLRSPINNCSAAIQNVREKIKPHLKMDASLQTAGVETGKHTQAPVRNTKISRMDVLWYFKRKEVFALATELERTKATFSAAMGNVTLEEAKSNANSLLTMKTNAIIKGSTVLQGDYHFSNDLGTALTKYAASVVDVRSEDQSIISQTESTISVAPLPAAPSGIEQAEGLKSAVSNNSVFLLKTLLQHVHVDSRDRKGRTALSHASEQGKLEIARLLIEHGASVSARQWSVSGWSEGRNPYWESGATPLYYAVSQRHTDIVRLLLLHGANPEARKTSGCPLVQTAAGVDCIEIVRLLLDKKVDVNARNYKDGWAALHAASKIGNTEIIKLLLEHGAFPDIPLRQPDSKTPLHLAIESQKLEAAETLLQYGADSNARMLEDVTLLHLAAAGGWVPGIELLVSNSADLDSRDALLHETPLHKAARNCEMLAIEKLSELGANTRAMNVDGQTYEEILECARADPDEWRVDRHLAIYMSKDMWWSR
ncbi:hypothetical protein MW887_003460 [Aspergillus wentii]|nr:hypothetical protein MW887_003460 [Aspergillus wentii]